MNTFIPKTLLEDLPKLDQINQLNKSKPSKKRADESALNESLANVLSPSLGKHAAGSSSLSPIQRHKLLENKPPISSPLASDAARVKDSDNLQRHALLAAASAVSAPPVGTASYSSLPKNDSITSSSISLQSSRNGAGPAPEDVFRHKGGAITARQDAIELLAVLKRYTYEFDLAPATEDNITMYIARINDVFQTVVGWVATNVTERGQLLQEIKDQQTRILDKYRHRLSESKKYTEKLLNNEATLTEYIKSSKITAEFILGRTRNAEEFIEAQMKVDLQDAIMADAESIIKKQRDAIKQELLSSIKDTSDWILISLKLCHDYASNTGKTDLVNLSESLVKVFHLKEEICVNIMDSSAFFLKKISESTEAWLKSWIELSQCSTGLHNILRKEAKVIQLEVSKRIREITEAHVEEQSDAGISIMFSNWVARVGANSTKKKHENHNLQTFLYAQMQAYDTFVHDVDDILGICHTVDKRSAREVRLAVEATKTFHGRIAVAVQNETSGDDPVSTILAEHKNKLVSANLLEFMYKIEELKEFHASLTKLLVMLDEQEDLTNAEFPNMIRLLSSQTTHLFQRTRDDILADFHSTVKNMSQFCIQKIYPKMSQDKVNLEHIRDDFQMTYTNIDSFATALSAPTTSVCQTVRHLVELWIKTACGIDEGAEVSPLMFVRPQRLRRARDDQEALNVLGDTIQSLTTEPLENKDE